MKILFWVPYPTQGPSNRFRVEQYLSYLEERNILYSLRPFWGIKGYRILYENGYYLKKIYYFLKGSIARFRDILKLADYDLVFIHREAYPIGGAFLEKFIFKKKPIVYDFDDAIFLPSSTHANRIIRLLKSQRKIAKIIKISTVVIVGNDYLKEYALQYNKNVRIIPTSIDTDKYFPSKVTRYDRRIVVGWIGTYSTNQYLYIINNVFSRLINKYGDRIEVRLIGCKYNLLNIAGVRYCKWALTTEVNELQGFDIGVMPMPDDNWTRGKCAFKIVQYMTVGASVVASEVGMNKEIISDGESGFLANSEDEWFRKISFLIENPGMRKKLGLAGRKIIEEKYSVRVNAPGFLEILQQVYNGEVRK